MITEDGLVLDREVETLPSYEAELVFGEGIAAVLHRTVLVLGAILKEGDVSRERGTVFLGGRGDHVLAGGGILVKVHVPLFNQGRERDRGVHEERLVEPAGVPNRLGYRLGPELAVLGRTHALAAIRHLVDAGLDHLLHEGGDVQDPAIRGRGYRVTGDEVAIEEGLNRPLVDELWIRRIQVPALNERDQLPI